MQPGDMHFAAVWPVANGGMSRKSIVPFQCSLAEASETLDRLACTHEAISAAVSGDEIGTAVLGAFCVFSAATASSSAFIVVGTKTWTVASSVISYIRRVQAELTRDPVDFGYWQLRSLAWRAEEAVDGEDTSINTMPPRLIEGRDWDDEESESWEEDDVRSGRACDSPSAKAEPVVASGGGACAADTARLGEWTPGVVEPRDDMGASTGDTVKLEKGTTSVVTAGPASHDWGNPFFRANSNESPSVLGAPMTPEPSMIDQRKSPLIDFFASTTSAPAQSSGAFTSSAEIGQGHRPSVDLLTAPVTPSSAAGIAVTAPVHGPSSMVNALGPQFVATAPLITLAAIKQPEPAIKDNTTVASNGGINLLEGLEDENVQDNKTRSDASGHAQEASQSTTPVPGARKLLAAVREDLAYVHRGKTLQKYAITGSVLVTTSENRVIMRLTDRQGHIAKANANPAVATEISSSTLPTREYSCDTLSQTMGVTRPKYLRAVMYSCSPAVRQLPVRVTCQLRTVGGAVLVRAQIIVNPQILAPLENISALIHLPFSPRIEGNVKSEPQATWNADRRILKWDLPSSMSGGDRMVLQARLVVDEATVHEGAIPPNAPAMVECQLSDTTFSSIEFTASKANVLDGFEVTGEVVKRCWVRCRQQC